MKFVICRAQDDAEQKSLEISALYKQLEEVKTKMTDIEKELDSARRETADAKKERIVAVKAKELAEQQMVSVEYEYEQHKVRASRREQELIEQLNSLADNDEAQKLKERLKAITEKANALETQLWQNEKKYQTDFDSLKEKICQEKLNCKNADEQIDKLKGLQNEYDEVSMQLVDSIQENDVLKRKCTDLQETVDKLNGQIDGLKSELNSESQKIPIADEFEAKMQQQNEAHASEVQKLKAEYRTEIESLTKQLDERSKLIEESQECIDCLRSEIEDVKAVHDDVLENYMQTQHKNTLLENACSQCRLTLDFVTKEMEVLRQAYNTLRMSQAEQELEHLKLQKTICEYDETINGSVFNDTASISVVNNTTQLNSNNTMNLNHSEKTDAASNELLVELQKSNEERDNYASQLDSIKSKLKNVDALGEEFSSIQDDVTQILEKLVAIYAEFNGIKSFLGENEINENKVSADSQSVLEVIKSCWNRYKDIENDHVSMGNELKYAVFFNGIPKNFQIKHN